MSTDKTRPMPVIEFQTLSDWEVSYTYKWEDGDTLESIVANPKHSHDMPYRYQPGTEPELQRRWSGGWDRSTFDGNRTLESVLQEWPDLDNAYRYAPNPFAAKSVVEKPSIGDQIMVTFQVDTSKITKMLDDTVVLTKDEAALLYNAIKYMTASKAFEQIVNKLAEAVK